MPTAWYRSPGATPLAGLAPQLKRLSIIMSDVCDSLRNHSSALATLRRVSAPSRNGLSHANRVRNEVIAAMKKHGCVYFAATGGAGALLSKRIIKSEIICYEDLGPEAIRKLEVKDFPVIVAIDAAGGNLYEPAGTAPKAGTQCFAP